MCRGGTGCTEFHNSQSVDEIDGGAYAIQKAKDPQLVVLGYYGVLKSVSLYEAASLHVRIVYL